jgi:type IV pilus assembly protein PilE
MDMNDSRMKPTRWVGKPRGFTLVELLVVIAIIAFLVALAVPSFSNYVRKGKRAEAQQLLMNWANNQEIWRANHTTFAANAASPNGIPAPSHDNYTFSIADVTATSYTLTATATGNQANDNDKGVTCTPLTLDEAGDKGPKKADGVTAACWGR